MIAAALQLATYGLALAGCAALAVRQLGRLERE
jgi:hypothetical protein